MLGAFHSNSNHILANCEIKVTLQGNIVAEINNDQTKFKAGCLNQFKAPQKRVGGGEEAKSFVPSPNYLGLALMNRNLEELYHSYKLMLHFVFESLAEKNVTYRTFEDCLVKHTQ